jgi:hypothetical protein
MDLEFLISFNVWSLDFGDLCMIREVCFLDMIQDERIEDQFFFLEIGKI